MKKLILIIATALAVSGCATQFQTPEIFRRPEQEKRLARAVTLLKKGKTSAATKLLAEVCAEPGMPGVSDEALIRLSLLRLTAGQAGYQQAHHDLERLTREYPTSSWAPLAANLIQHLDSADAARQQNLSLTKENKDLRQSIDQLKSLELELGRGKR